MRGSATAAPIIGTLALKLDRRAGDRTKRAEHAAISRFRAQQRATALALVEELAGIGWHFLGLSIAALWAGYLRAPCGVHGHGNSTAASATAPDCYVR